MMQCNFGPGADIGKLACNRAKWFAKSTRRAQELSEEEGALRSGLTEHVCKILNPKRSLLWKEILMELGYPDMAVFDEVLGGTHLVGEVPSCGMFEKKFKHTEMTVEQLAALSSAESRKNFPRCGSSGDDEVDRSVY